MIYKEIYIKEDTNIRLDVYLSNNINEISRSEIQRLIKEQYILVNGKSKKAKYMPKEGDLISLQINKPVKQEIYPENINLDIIYEDNDLAIINKPQGMIVHPSKNIYNNTLVNALLYNFKNLSFYGGDFRPGIVHRLDKDTSGLLIVAKNDESHKKLSQQFIKQEVKREYVALVDGVIKNDEGVIDEPIGRNPKDRKKRAVVHNNSRRAVTHYKVMERFEKYTLVKLKLDTGRTHQIRVHLSYIKHPIVGDPMYSHQDKFNLNAQLLHSLSIGFVHPSTNKYMEFSTELPLRFQKVIEKII